MRLLFAVLFLLNIAYHDTCGPGPGTGYVGRHEAMGGGYGRMGMMGHLGQMGQMLRRNGNVFQMLPIKKNVGILPKQWGRFLPNPTYIFFTVFTGETATKWS